MSKESTFGTEPERLKRLLTAIGLEESNGGEPNSYISSPTTDGRRLMEPLGTRIGRYKLLRMLGEGGMGIVYLAEQQGSIRRRVALKVIKPGMDSERVLARFEAERQALALLDHPNIAHVYDSGTTEAGRPYFVMEHVKGLSVTEHCDHYKLTIKERLQLFQRICHAVHHAHQKGIIHRDIKPSNILVTIHEDQGVPKIIDFGVAKAVSHPLTERTLYTEQGQLFGTPEYMSPEQADMATEDIDTRSDIYSLGVLLYKLLTGALPFDSDTLRGEGLDNIRKVICETDPKTPSTRLTRMGEEAKKVAENRRTEVEALAKRLHRELEWIPLKAMRKERSQRYRSASELSDDIENYLRGEPLIAGPPTAGYRLRKFLRRHRAIVGGLAAVLLVSVIGAIVSVYFALGQANALAEQTRALAENRAIAEFLTNDLLRPFAGDIEYPSIREVFDAATEKLGTQFADYPLREAELRHIFGRIYGWQFGDKYLALPHLERAAELWRREADELHGGNYLGLTYIFVGKYKKAEATFREIVEYLEEEGLEGRSKGSMILYYAIKSHLGETYRRLGRYDEAEPYLREAPLHPWWEKGHWRERFYVGRIANLLRDQGRYDEAKQLYDDLLEGSRIALDEGHPGIIKQLGMLHILQDNLDEAAPLIEKALTQSQNEYGEQHDRTIGLKIALAILRTKQGDYENAESLFDETLRNMQGRLDEDHPDLLGAKSHLGVLYREQGRHDEAQKLLSRVIEDQSEKLGPAHPHTLESMHELALLYKEQQRYDEAEKLLIETVDGRRLKLGDTHPHMLESWNNLIALYEAWNKPEKANEWRAKLPSGKRSGQ